VFAAVAFLLDAGDLRATVSSFRRTANRWLATR
jgi:hypothetical protein